LEPGGEGIELRDRARERAVGAADFAIGEIGAREIAAGAIGISGDGIDQDDMISFLGLYNGGKRAGTIGHADPAIRISQKSFPTADGGFLPYVQCPFAPFIDTADQNVCQGK
jgi:hypothetical protein